MNELERPILSKLKVIVMILLTANFWYSGVLLVSTIHNYFGWNLTVFLILMCLSYPFAIISIRGVEWLVRLTPSESRKPVVAITIAVSFMHTIAFIVVPDIYTVFDDTSRLFAVSWLGFFSVAVLLASQRRSNAHTS